MNRNVRVPLRPRSNRRLWPDWVVGVIVGGFGLVLLVSAFLIFTAVRDFVAGWAITGPAGPVLDPRATQVGLANKPPATAAPLIPQKWAGAERVTVLVLGIDRRSGDTEKGYRTDTLMLVTVDPLARTAAVLTIPRDLWVDIPDYGSDTINTANFYGDVYEYPGGGPALAVRTIEHNFGIPVNYYVRIDFTAFETVVDTIGGIDIDNPAEIDDPEYPAITGYGYDPFYLAAGPQHLNGYDALRYARTRHGSTDVDRGTRQRQVVMAVFDRVLSRDMLPTLITKAPTLYRTLNDNVSTNMTLDQMVSLALLAKEIPRGSVQSEGITYEYVLEYTLPNERQVLVPLMDEIRELRDRLFLSAVIAPRATLNLDDPAMLTTEQAKVEVLNGAGVAGLAQSTAEWLKRQGVNVVAYDTADRSDYPTSMIINHTGKLYTARWLAQTFRVPDGSVLSSSESGGAVDVTVILGQDWSVPGAP